MRLSPGTSLIWRRVRIGQSKALTAAVAAAGVQGVVRGAAAAVAAGHGEAQLPTLPVAVHAVVEAVLPGGVEHQDVHDEVQVALDEGAVPAAGLVGPLDAVQVQPGGRKFVRWVGIQ